MKQKIKERNPEDIPQLRTAITEIFRTTTLITTLLKFVLLLAEMFMIFYWDVQQIMVNVFHKLSLYVFIKIKKLKICCVVPKKIILK